jgi:plastocyanin
MTRLIALAGAVLTLAGLAMSWHPGIDAANVGIDIEDDFYQDSSGDANTTIAVGDTVTWTWMGSNPHTVTSTGNFDSGDLNQTTGTFAHTFSSAGSFNYFCQIHGTSMSGTINVQQAAPTATNTTTTQPTATRTSEASSTPVTATSTAVASATPAPAATLPVDPTAEAAAPISAPAPSGGGGAGVGAPQTGYGVAGTGVNVHAMSIALSAFGLALVAGAVFLRRRRA